MLLYSSIQIMNRRNENNDIDIKHISVSDSRSDYSCEMKTISLENCFWSASLIVDVSAKILELNKYTAVVLHRNS